VLGTFAGISVLAMIHQVQEHCRGLLSDVVGTPDGAGLTAPGRSALAFWAPMGSRIVASTGPLATFEHVLAICGATLPPELGGYRNAGRSLGGRPAESWSWAVMTLSARKARTSTDLGPSSTLH
jgi:hypothetical protein